MDYVMYTSLETRVHVHIDFLPFTPHSPVCVKQFF